MGLDCTPLRAGRAGRAGAEVTLEQVLQQGGLVAVCGMLIWLLKEQGKRLTENAQAYMAFGERTSKALTELSQGQALMTATLRDIVETMRSDTVCPVMRVTAEELRAGDTAGRRRVDALVRARLDEAHGEGR